jgi:hypothetical protein
MCILIYHFKYVMIIFFIFVIIVTEHFYGYIFYLNRK